QVNPSWMKRTNSSSFGVKIAPSPCGRGLGRGEAVPVAAAMLRSPRQLLLRCSTSCIHAIVFQRFAPLSPARGERNGLAHHWAQSNAEQALLRAQGERYVVDSVRGELVEP